MESSRSDQRRGQLASLPSGSQSPPVQPPLIVGPPLVPKPGDDHGVYNTTAASGITSSAQFDLTPRLPLYRWSLWFADAVLYVNVVEFAVVAIRHHRRRESHR